MNFVTKTFRKDETLTSWTLLQHICPHFWAWLLNTIANHAQKWGQICWKSVQLDRIAFFRSDFFQNWYFSENWWFQEFFLRQLNQSMQDRPLSDAVSLGQSIYNINSLIAKIISEWGCNFWFILSKPLLQARAK